jgi:hypothetical protein
VEIREMQPQDREGVLAMYRSLDLEQRAQGLPPLTEERRAVWVDERWRAARTSSRGRTGGLSATRRWCSAA